MFLKVKSKKLKAERLKLNALNRILLPFAFCLLPLLVEGQCAMCRAALESEGSGVKAEAINDGIVYLMVIPYVLVGAAFYYIYKLKFGKKKE